MNFENPINNNLDLTVYTFGKESCEKNYSYGPSIRSGYIIHFILKGKGKYKVGDKVYHLEKNEAFLIEPNNLVYYEADSVDPWEYIWVGFYGVKAKDYLNKTILNEHLIFNFNPNTKLIETLENMVKCGIISINRDMILLSHLYLFLYELCKEFPNEKRSIELRQQSYIENAIRFINENYANELTVEDVALHVSLNRSYLHRLFKQYLHQSPQNYIINLKIERSCHLLENTNYRISDIARSVGYSDALLFTKMFKKMKGISPSHFRNNLL
ncbi:AraC family transcriptional regulator [Oceanobacillus oncorhynchi]|uniref:AraC family transcriptional regulator n=1 Tax=Oceanobacillus oncorhynchi TaxID=545501 RepID=UPI002116AC25|nr:AraC family transcriptional regulator [Oceanobacillus oncorhynchi]UUI40629.1 AraC family transcriptional regulator [Oceanobacillus oncorhynchi]